MSVNQFIIISELGGSRLKKPEPIKKVRCEKRRGKYQNPHIDSTYRRLWNIILWKLGLYQDRLEKTLAPHDFIYPSPKKELSLKEPVVRWINHCTFLIEAYGNTILTDPVWADICSPVSFIGPKRRHPPGIKLKDLPKIDFVLVSHNHYDHLDYEAVKQLHKNHPKVDWIIPEGMKLWFRNRGIQNTHEYNWWDSHTFPTNRVPVKITAVPTQHFSGRLSVHGNTSIWNGYVCEIGDRKLYFTGDTGYNEHDFKEIGNTWKGFDLSLIPIGTYIPKKFMKPVHVSPYEAVQIHEDVQSKMSIGMHWKTFCLSDEAMDRPPYDLYLALKDANLCPEDFFIVKPGEKVNW